MHVETTTMIQQVERAPSATVEAVAEGARLGLETKVTTHHILRAFDGDKRGLDVLHQDLIQVNGFAEPVKVFKPYEISLDLPEELDPLKAKGNPSAAERGA
jgi:hypothetical protein